MGNVTNAMVVDERNDGKCPNCGEHPHIPSGLNEWHEGYCWNCGRRVRVNRVHILDTELDVQLHNNGYFAGRYVHRVLLLETGLVEDASSS